MNISKRLRYEILKRDGFKCRYCGTTSQDTELTIDHVLPVALGGTDDPTNLVVACLDCNLGKSSSPADAEHVAQVAADAERWARAIEEAADQMQASRAAESTYATAFLEVWPSYYRLPADWDVSVMRFQSAGLPQKVMVDAAHSAIGNARVAGGAAKFRYFAGICWARVRELQDRAAAIIEEQDGHP